MPRPPKPNKMSLKTKILWLIIFGVLFYLLRQTMMLLLVGMLPTVVVVFIDHSREKLWLKTIFAFNMSGVYPYVLEVMMVHDNSMQAIQETMADSVAWLVMYGAAGCGYAAMWFFPLFSEFCMRIFNRKKIEHHHKKLRMLEDEWGIGEQVAMDLER